MMHDKRFAIVVAGGKGERMGTTVPKQFLVLAGLPILMHTLKAFRKADPKITLVLVLPVSEILFWKQLCVQYDFNIKHLLIEGGVTRFDSVKNGLNQITEEGVIAVHDGVRPFVNRDLILNGFEAAAVHGTAIPALNVSESIRIVENGKNKALDRSKYFIIQTPQCFASQLLKRAYLQPFKEVYTDDASVVEALGETVHLIAGSRMNLKITSPEDLVIAEAFLKDISDC